MAHSGSRWICSDGDAGVDRLGLITLVIASARVAAAGVVALLGPEVNKRTVEQIAD